MSHSPGVLQDGDARIGQRLSTAIDLRELGAPAHLQRALDALRGAIVAQRRRPLLALFVGSPGHGQALAAAALGRAVGLAVVRVDLSAVVSKYIGETEKNLDRIFAQAARPDDILLFDEADALFGKRTEVHDAHDRYANLEASDLLRRLDAHAGLAIVATNSRTHIDPAFLRRAQHVLYFQTPLHPPRP